MSRLEREFLDADFTPVLSDKTNTEQPKAKKQKTRQSKSLPTCIVHIQTNFDVFVTTLHFVYMYMYICMHCASCMHTFFF